MTAATSERAPADMPPTTTMQFRSMLKAGLSLAVVVVTFAVILPRVADFGQVWRVLTDMTWLEAFTLGLVAAWNLVTYWLLMMAALPGLSPAQAMVATETSTAIANTLPGGAAFGMGVTFSMYASWGYTRPVVALAIAVSGFADLFAKLAMPAVALVFLVAYGEGSPGLITAAVIGVIALAGSVVAGWMTLTSEASARKVGDALSRAASVLRVRRRSRRSWAGAFADFRAEAVGLLGRRRWWLIAAGLLSHVSLFLVLLLALRHVGVSEEQVSWAEALGGFAFVRFLSAVPITPGGLGIMELGLSAALVYAGGPRAEVVAAVLVFRALTYLLQIPFGAITYIYWQHNTRWRAG